MYFYLVFLDQTCQKAYIYHVNIHLLHYEMKIFKETNLLISILLSIFIAVSVCAIFTYGDDLSIILINFFQPDNKYLWWEGAKNDTFFWWRTTLLVLLAVSYSLFVQKSKSKSMFLDSCLFLLGWFTLDLISNIFLGIDLLFMPVVLIVLLIFLTLRSRKLQKLETEFSEKLLKLTLIDDFLNKEKGDLRVESGLKLLKTVLPVSEVIVFRFESNGKLKPVGRTRNQNKNENLAFKTNFLETKFGSLRGCLKKRQDFSAT